MYNSLFKLFHSKYGDKVAMNLNDSLFSFNFSDMLGTYDNGTTLGAGMYENNQSDQYDSLYETYITTAYKILEALVKSQNFVYRDTSALLCFNLLLAAIEIKFKSILLSVSTSEDKFTTLNTHDIPKLGTEIKKGVRVKLQAGELGEKDTELICKIVCSIEKFHKNLKSNKIDIVSSRYSYSKDKDHPNFLYKNISYDPVIMSDAILSIYRGFWNIDTILEIASD